MTAAELTTADGVHLAARWWHPSGPDGRGEAVVVVHGFCGRKEDPAVELVARREAARGRHVLTFDLRGHGASGGETTMGRREGLDVDAAVAAARADADTVVVVGSSMGGVASIEHLAGTGARRSAPGRADAAVLVATPARWKVPPTPRGVLAMALTQTRAGRAVASRRMGTRIAVRPGRGHEPAVRLAHVTRPVAVVHGLDDRFIGPEAARDLYAALAGPRLLDLVSGMGHGLSEQALEPIGAAVTWALGSSAAAERNDDTESDDRSGMAEA